MRSPPDPAPTGSFCKTGWKKSGGVVFRGVAQLNLDSKGRLAVPSRFRDALTARCSGNLVLTADSDRCLLIYPLPDWEPIEQKLMALSSFNAQIRELQRRLVGYAEDVVIDATGRTDEPGHLAASALIGVGGFLGERMKPSVDVGVGLLVIVHQRLDHLARLLGGRRVVQVHQRLVVDAPREDREILADRGDVKRAAIRDARISIL